MSEGRWGWQEHRQLVQDLSHIKPPERKAAKHGADWLPRPAHKPKPDHPGKGQNDPF